MMPLLQLFGAIAIVVGLLGTWLAGQRRTGWLVCIVSTVLWLPALVSGEQWAAVVNCGLSVAICTRNFLAGAATAVKASASSRAAGWPEPAQVGRRLASAGCGVRRMTRLSRPVRPAISRPRAGRCAGP
jgi:hypothetical protein